MKNKTHKNHDKFIPGTTKGSPGTTTGTCTTVSEQQP